MGVIAAGLAVAAVGAGVSAYGAAKNASAMKSANNAAAYEEDMLFERQSDKLNKLVKQKENKLYDLGNIFDRFESTGAFGDTETLKNLRQAQEDFSLLAAGDFTGFESQLRKSMSDALINTVGSGSPVGSYAQLAADTQMQYRKEGIQTTVGITEFLSNEANKLLGAEFGIMDQRFNSQYEMDRNRVANKNNYSLGAAATEGVALSAYGNAAAQIGGSIASYGAYQDSKNFQQQQLDIAQQQADAMSRRSRVASPGYTPPTYDGPSLSGSNSSTRQPTPPSGGWETGPDLPEYRTDFPISPFRGSAYGTNLWDTKMYPEEAGYGYDSAKYDDNYGMVLPPKTASASLSSIGRSIVMG
jgi:hypothetical protein